MSERVLDTMARLRAEGRPFAAALVVRCESPTSAKPGAKAAITPDGTIIGWIGGGCAQPIVSEQARTCLREGRPRLIRISPEQGLSEVPGMLNFEMACHSGGTMDIFIEPVLPRQRLVLLGRSPVAQALTRLGAAMGYDVLVHAPGAEPDDFPAAREIAGRLALPERVDNRTYVVISTQGEYDEDALEVALERDVPYVAFVASPTKWRALSAYLRERGLAPARIERVKVPAGLEIHAGEAEEIALAILAEMVLLRRTDALFDVEGGDEAQAGGPQGEATDPVCGMTVRMAGARHVSEHEGRRVYFCCAACRHAFEKDPPRYLAGAGTGGGSAPDEAPGAAGDTAASPHAVDPVCRMAVDPAHASDSSEHGGRRYYFCSGACRQRFEQGPERFVEVA